MPRTVRIRYQVERVLAVLSGVAFLMSLLVPEWIELLTGASPDGGDGGAEWGFSIVLLIGTLLFTLAARRDRRAARFTG
jgi:hypothetical protein